MYDGTVILQRFHLCELEMGNKKNGRSGYGFPTVSGRDVSLHGVGETFSGTCHLAPFAGCRRRGHEQMI